MNCPKFKAHPWTTVTFSMKNYIGIQDDRHRLIDHDHRLNEKIAELPRLFGSLKPVARALDGSLSTYFDAPAAKGSVGWARLTASSFSS